jgi:hypothetical protein
MKGLASWKIVYHQFGKYAYHAIRRKKSATFEHVAIDAKNAPRAWTGCSVDNVDARSGARTPSTADMGRKVVTTTAHLAGMSYKPIGSRSASDAKRPRA